ncbi:MAG: L-serine ammonia-lyase, iron-sulfur-dependent, subunit alpha [Lachnospiraceae bacterium]|nr:L-serine ammonia-lyase, iron-sulfur-dependent, subunit alpha [Lachnospiraceae bacterium]
MSLSLAECNNYTNILKKELVPAMGCTEPIAVAYAAAKVGEVLGEKATHLNVRCSGNIIKNVKGVTVPNSGNQKGIEVAATLGIIGGDASKELEVIAEVTDEDRHKAGELVAEGFCEVELEEGVPNLYIKATATGDNHTACVLIEDNHTNITLIEKDGEVLSRSHRHIEDNDSNEENRFVKLDYKKMSLRGIIEYADSVNIECIRPVIEKQIECNTAISDEGLKNPWGARVGKTFLENWSDDVKTKACARAAAGSDARMSGCPLPVVINSGSGNQGITVTMPVLTYAEEWKVSEEKKFRALLISNLVSIYIKHYIGALSAFCGAVSAATGAGAAITYLSGGDINAIGRTIKNTLGNVGGIVCDGAKPSCAAKIASSVHACLMAHYMSVSDKEFKGGEGFIEDDVEKTIKNMGYIGKVGMKETDVEILNVMIDKVDVDKEL